MCDAGYQSTLTMITKVKLDSLNSSVIFLMLHNFRFAVRQIKKKEARVTWYRDWFIWLVFFPEVKMTTRCPCNYPKWPYFAPSDKQQTFSFVCNNWLTTIPFQILALMSSVERAFVTVLQTIFEAGLFSLLKITKILVTIPNFVRLNST